MVSQMELSLSQKLHLVVGGKGMDFGAMVD